MREDLFEIIRTAKEMGFKQVQIATNGIKIAGTPEYAQELKDTGLNTVYLHFDGVSRETNPFLKQHLKAVENLKRVRLGTVLVPTIIRGRNDHEIGEIIRFAANNISAIRGVNFQPVAFTGAASDEDIRKSRITIPDLLQKIEDQMAGISKKGRFLPGSLRPAILRSCRGIHGQAAGPLHCPPALRGSHVRIRAGRQFRAREPYGECGEIL